MLLRLKTKTMTHMLIRHYILDTYGYH